MVLKKEDLIELLKTGDIENFNKDRPYDDCDLVDFAESELSGAEIEGANLNNGDFTGSLFSENDFVETNFSNSNLNSVDFTRTNLSQCNFTSADLTGAIFIGAGVNNCDFAEADLNGADFAGADLTGSDFSLALNLEQCTFDDETIWPDEDYLPDDFDTGVAKDLASLSDEEDSNDDFNY